ncbi:MAG: glycosyltransferase family 2 protein [Chitinophagales bacterium]|nr:glycosyltransferase family 2 protein [Chitinophagales bacterium]
MTLLSAVIITFNEERNILNCLESVKPVADEIVVVDSFSTDETKAICSRYNVRFVEHTFEGYIEQKNFALSQASHTHVLSLDADECLSPELQLSVLGVKSNWQKHGYFMNRLNNFCGKWIRHGGWYPDRKLRLFDRRRGQWGGNNPHDRVTMAPQSSIGFLHGNLLHYSAETEQQYLKKMERYTQIAAEALFLQKKSTHLVAVYAKTAVAFIRNYFLLLGFLDGHAGIQVCLMAARYNYLKYSKLLTLQRKK